MIGLGGVGCGARSGLESFGANASPGPSSDASGDISFPVGTFTRCATGLRSADGNAFFNLAGFQPGASLTLTRTGSVVHAAFVDREGVTSGFDFTTTSSASATLASVSQVRETFSSICVMGVGVMYERFAPAALTVSTGALTYEANTVFLVADGVVSDVEAGPCGVRSSPASYWISCAADGSAPSSPPSTSGASAIPLGEWACNSQVETLASSDGKTFVGGSGAEHTTLTLSRDGTEVIARYSNDRSLAGTLRFVGTTATTALAQLDQSVDAPCEIPSAIGVPPKPDPERLSVSAASLALDGKTLFLSIAGATSSDAPSSCAGASWAATVMCTKS